MIVKEIGTWANFKTRKDEGLLTIYFKDTGDRYDLLAPNAAVGVAWTTILKKGSTDANDFEANFKASSKEIT